MGQSSRWFRLGRYFVRGFREGIERGTHKVLAVGSVLSGSDFNLAPIGTTVRGEFGTRVKVGPGEQWLHTEGDHVGGLDRYSVDYRVTFLPGQPKDEDPVLDLAKELWDVRNKTLIGTRWEYSSTVMTEERERIYRALAQFVLDREPAEKFHPAQLIDRDGDRWVHEGNGLYTVVWADGRKANSDSYMNRTEKDVRDIYGFEDE